MSRNFVEISARLPPPRSEKIRHAPRAVAPQNSSKGDGSQISTSLRRPHCFRASSEIRRQRCNRCPARSSARLMSLCSVTIGTIRVALGRFLNHPIEFVAFDQSLRQRQLEWRFYDVVEPPQQVQINLVFGDARDLAFVFDAFAVEHECPRAGAEPQDPRQMTRLVGVEPDGGLGETRWRGVKTVTLHPDYNITIRI